MIIVNLKKNVKTFEQIDKMLKLFKKKVKNSGLLKECSENMFYTKPSDEKRKKRLISKYRTKKNQKKFV